MIPLVRWFYRWQDRIHGLAVSGISVIFRTGCAILARRAAAASFGWGLVDLEPSCDFLPTAAADALERLTTKPKSDLSFNGPEVVVTALSEVTLATALSVRLGCAVMVVESAGFTVTGVGIEAIVAT